MPARESPLPWNRERARLEQLLPAYVAGRRWFRSKSNQISALRILDAVPLSAQAAMTVLEIAVAERRDRYALPLSVLSGAAADQLEREKSPLAIARLENGGLLCDALADLQALSALLAGFGSLHSVAGSDSALSFQSSPQARDALASPPLEGAFVPHPLGVEQSNSSIAYGNRFILKILRLLDAGESADLEMSRFLSQAGFANAPRLEGSIAWVPRQGAPSTLGILQAFVPNQGGAWERTLERLAQLLAEHPEPPGEDLAAILHPHQERAKLLGRRTAELHLALGKTTGDPAFDPEPMTLAQQQQLVESATSSLDSSLRLLRERAATGTRTSLPLWAGEVRAWLQAFGESPVGGMLTRVHGDLHLGQLLESGDDVALIDFEGEPARPLSERRAKRSPLVDVAGMLRSFHYAATVATRTSGGRRWESAWMNAWRHAVSDAYAQTYFERIAGSPLLPAKQADRDRALGFFLFEKCLYELVYELDNRPDWVAVPLAGLKQLLEEGSRKNRA